jgi:hypothetical protein
MSHIATQPIRSRERAPVATRRHRLVSLLGPLTMLAGVAWAIAQPYRVTLLHPYDQGFWWLFVEPPLLVVLAGALFHVFVARPLLDDLDEPGAG